jgi:hypothetical protein
LYRLIKSLLSAILGKNKNIPVRSAGNITVENIGPAGGVWIYGLE